jgi:dihydropteroate synthase
MNLTLDPSHHRKPTLIMGILNLTPDSFSDGGKHSLNGESIVNTVRQMIDDGAHIIDIGGQSTRPNADEVSLEEELDRVIPAIQAIRQAGLKIPISVDTYQSAVAEAAVQEGADIINDISAGTLDPAMFPLMAKLNVPTILMHMRGTPKTMNSLTEYHGDLIDTIAQELSTRVDEAIRSGIRRWNIILDPGLGFAKQGAQNVEILRRLGELRAHPKLSGMPWLVGPSRKRFIGKITGEEIAKERIWGTAGAVAASVQGGADIVRVHDIPEMSKIVKMSDAIWRNV